MTSKASRLRIKRTQRAGRPRKENAARFPSGQIKHEERERDIMAVAVEARKRIHGLDTNSIFAGYVGGRLFLDGRISECEREAGDRYAEMMVRYYRLVGIPAPSARAQSLFSVKGHDGDISEELAKRARSASDQMMKLEGILLRLKDGPRIKTTVFNTFVLDLDILRTMSETQLSWLRRGLQEIHFQLGLPKSRSVA